MALPYSAIVMNDSLISGLVSMIPENNFVLIFANGVIPDTSWFEPYLPRALAVIAADGGIRYPLAAGLLPDLLVGDLDSLPDGVSESMAEWEMEVIRYSRDKDETDLELALLLAARRFPEARLYILGGFGGRLDHTLANILLLAHPLLVGHPVFFLSEGELAWLIASESEILGEPGDTVSLIPLGGPAHVAETAGLRWALIDETLDFGPARGMSNELTGTRATIRLARGLLLCFHTSRRREG